MRKAVPKSEVMLVGEHCCRDQNRHLLPVLYSLKSGADGHLGFAKPNITTDKAVHRALPFHINLYISDGLFLIRCLLIGKAILKLPLPDSILGKGITWSIAALRIKSEQAFSQLLNALFDTLLEARPVTASHPGKTRCSPFRTCVLLNQVHLIHRHK